MMSVLVCGLSMPLSMMVVATSTSMLAGRERLHHPLELVLGHLAVRRRRCAPRARRRARGATASSMRLDAVARRSRPARRARARGGSRRATTSASYSPTCTCTGKRLGGGVSMTDMSRTPDSDICSVRGIGVAVSVSTSTCSRRFFRCSLCSTPKRCSSSMTTRPRSLGRDVAREQPVRADEHVDLAVGEAARAPSSCCASVRKRESTSTLHRERREALGEGREVLLREDRRRAQHHDLLAVLRRLERRADGDLGLAVADVAADEPVHRLVGLHVGLHVGDRRELVGRLLEGERSPPSRAATACPGRRRSPSTVARRA